jgi:glutathione S-transferase
MKLYTAPGTCSLACTIALHEVGGDFTLEKANIRTKVTASGADFRSINPKGAVPALEFAPGEVLTEGAAIMQFIADSKGGAGVVPVAGTVERARMQEAMHFIGAELHKAYSPMFNPAITPEAKAAQMALVDAKLGWLESRLADGRAYLIGADFTLADSYLFTISNWSAYFAHDLAPFPHVVLLRARVAERPAVQAAIQAEAAL